MIFQRLSTLLRAIRAHYDAHVTPGGLTYAQARVLSAIGDLPGATQAELALETRLEPPTMKRHLDTLEQAGLIVRGEAEGDRRKRLVQLTPAALALDLPRRRKAFEAVITRGIDPADLAIAAAVMERMEENLRRGPEE